MGNSSLTFKDSQVYSWVLIKLRLRGCKYYIMHQSQSQSHLYSEQVGEQVIIVNYPIYSTQSLIYMYMC